MHDLVAEGYTAANVSSIANATTNAFMQNGSMNSSDLKCMMDNGYNHYISRGSHSSNKIDPNVCGNLINAENVGMPHRDVYLEPCGTCSTGDMDNQLNDLIWHLEQNCSSAWNRFIWINVNYSAWWTNGDSTN